MRGLALKLLTSPPARALFRGWTARTLPVVMYHRFSTDGRAGTVSAEELESTLDAMRGAGLTPVSLGDLGERLAEGTLPRRSICFTVDDGYRDFADVAWPVFEKHATPVTVFVTSGFIDGTMWNWWDRVTHALESSGSDRDPEAFIESCKDVPDARRLQMIEALETELGASLPATPPDAYAAMDWATVRRLAGEGVEFGGHTMTHPILSRVDDERLRAELAGSLAAVREATGAPVRSFAYPNGRERDFDARAFGLLRELGVRVAVTTEYGLLDRHALAGPDALLRLPRVTLAEDAPRRMALFCGLEGAKADLRRK